jgi:hypothetical protein
MQGGHTNVDVITRLQDEALWKIFVPKEKEVTGRLWKLHDGEHHNFYTLPNIIRM